MNEKEEKALSAFEQGRTALGEAKPGEVSRDVAGELLTVSMAVHCHVYSHRNISFIGYRGQRHRRENEGRQVEESFRIVGAQGDGSRD